MVVENIVGKKISNCCIVKKKKPCPSPSESTILLTGKREKITKRLFSSPQYNMLKENFCGHPVSVAHYQSSTFTLWAL